MLVISDDGKDDTEGEEFKKARELRRQEVRLQPLPANLPTDTETEVGDYLLSGLLAMGRLTLSLFSFIFLDSLTIFIIISFSWCWFQFMSLKILINS